MARIVRVNNLCPFEEVFILWSMDSESALTLCNIINKH